MPIQTDKDIQVNWSDIAAKYKKERTCLPIDFRSSLHIRFDLVSLFNGKSTFMIY